MTHTPADAASQEGETVELQHAENWLWRLYGGAQIPKPAAKPAKPAAPKRRKRA